jgi:hypothetical protein
LNREQLLEMLATGRATAKTLVSLDGEHFLPAGAVPALAPLASREAFAFAAPAAADVEWNLPLNRVAVPSLLYSIAVQRRTGLLIVKDSVRQQRIFLENGDPTFVASTDRAELLGHRLVASGAVQAKLVELALLNQPPHRLGEALVRLGALTPPQLLRELATQLEDRFLALSQFRTGEMLFVPGKKSSEESVRPPTPTLQLITRFIRESYDAAEVASLLGPLASRPLTRGPRYRAFSTLLGLEKTEFSALERASGTASVQTLVAELAREGTATMPEALRGVFIGLSAGVLRAEGWPHECERAAVKALAKRK